MRHDSCGAIRAVSDRIPMQPQTPAISVNHSWFFFGRKPKKSPLGTRPSRSTSDAVPHILLRTRKMMSHLISSHAQTGNHECTETLYFFQNRPRYVDHRETYVTANRTADRKFLIDRNAPLPHRRTYFVLMTRATIVTILTNDYKTGVSPIFVAFERNVYCLQQIGGRPAFFPFKTTLNPHRVRPQIARSRTSHTATSKILP